MVRILEELCREQMLSTELLAQRAGMDEQRVRAIIEGRWTPSPAERDRLASIFGLTRADIAWGHRTPVQHIHGHGPA